MVCSPNSMRGSGQDPAKRKAAGHSVNLQDFVTLTTWATPAARDHKGSPTELTRPDGKSRLDQLDQLDRQAETFLRPAPPIGDGLESSPTTPTLRLRLNPVFASWLMGFPTWWMNTGPTVFAQSEMALWRSRLRSLCDTYCGPLALSND
jgi:hypothetical protein